MARANLIKRIDAAFDKATGYEGGQEQTEVLSPEERRRRRKGKARMIIPDDDEEDEEEVEMQAITSIEPQVGTSSVGGGFLLDPIDASEQSGGGAGGFMQDDSSMNQPFPDDGQGGTTTAAFGGGFMPMETDVTDSATHTGGGGGGFFPEEQPFANFSAGAPNALPSGSGGGGFFPSTTLTDGYDPQPFDPTVSGGFLPQLPDVDFGGIDSLTLPTPPRPTRIPLSRVSRALRDLGVPRGSEREVLEMFEEVASDDENAEGGKSVRRERFIEALEVLLDEQEEEGGSEGGDEYNNEDGENGEGEEEGARSPPSRRRSTRNTRRSTRANLIQDSEEEEEEAADQELKETDFAEFSSESEESADPSSEDDGDLDNTKSGKAKARKGNTSTKGKSKKLKYDPHSKISKDKIAAASDTFDLFFESSPQLSLPQDARKIGLAELQRACRVLKEKFTEDDLTEMLEFAAEGTGLVDLEGFARILVETRL
ncbi:uncharacterized protein JCM6883_005988 [Sporobolomyces salmoneus]|uniref:uncharacterized protein n=1 Tax=Sporobolomyces salmoneus TaxID=183962 RepID=UPI003177345D